MKPFYPSNSCEGDGFIAQFCDHCVEHDPDDSRNSKSCQILINSLSTMDSFVEQWVCDPKPKCLAYKYHDWTQGEPEVIDPNQLELSL